MSTTAITPETIRRQYVGWDHPALPEAARRLSERYRQGSTLDLSRVIVVVPGQRAGRRLQELLAFLAEDEKLRLTPPEVVTEGRLPEMLYTPKLPFANDLTQALVWAQALRELPTDQRRHLVPHPPAAADALRWLALANVLRRLHVELAADGLDFAAVQREVSKLADAAETQRWQTLTAVQLCYHRLLDAQLLWDIQTARLKAVEFREIETDRDIILLGTVDLNATLRQMLDQVVARVTAFIVAPEELADRFDGHGCLVIDAWCASSIPLCDDWLRHVDGPQEQADAVTDWFRELGGRFRCDEVAIGVPDAGLVPQLQRQLKQSGVAARWVEGVVLAETAPYRLLAAASRFAAGRRYEDLAALIRHPDLEKWLAGQSQSTAADSKRTSLPAQLDRFYNKRLPARIGKGRSIHTERQWPELAPAIQHIDIWLEEASGRHALRHWGKIFRNMLGAVYGAMTLDLNDPAEESVHRVMQKIAGELESLDAIPETLDNAPLSAPDAFEVALSPLATDSLPPAAEPDAVEILGWLELPLDDSRALIVTSFNEGFVPQSAGADSFLPDRLRRALHLLHNERRYARDAYAISVLCRAREELRIVFARRNTDNDPLHPSRLLFAAPDEVLIARARRFFGGVHHSAAPRRLLLAGAAIPEKSLFEVPKPLPPGPAAERFVVTAFKDYLACPYRYYLRRIRKLRAVNDAARDLEANTFGTLLHNTLGLFGRDQAAGRHMDSPDRISDLLLETLNEVAKQTFGSERERPTILLQLEMARRRLRAFAVQQAQLVREGWRIIYAEDDNDKEAKLSTFFEVDKQSVTLEGRIDRIDYHQAETKVRILDYKTADDAQTPGQTHLYRKQWIDLQLPLYRHLWLSAVHGLPGTCTVELAYFNLPQKENDTKVAEGKWDTAQLEEADEVARDVIRNLRQAKFFPPAPIPPAFSEDLAAICLDNVMQPPADSDANDGGTP